MPNDKCLVGWYTNGSQYNRKRILERNSAAGRYTIKACEQGELGREFAQRRAEGNVDHGGRSLLRNHRAPSISRHSAHDGGRGLLAAAELLEGREAVGLHQEHHVLLVLCDPDLSVFELRCGSENQHF